MIMVVGGGIPTFLVFSRATGSLRECLYRCTYEFNPLRGESYGGARRVRSRLTARNALRAQLFVCMQGSLAVEKVP